MSTRPPTISSHSDDPNVQPAGSLIGLAAATLALAGAASTLVGWFLDIHSLTDWNGDGIPMFATTAVASFAAAGSLLVLSQRERLGSWAAAGVRVLAAGALTVALLTLFEHITGVDVGIDTLIVRHPWSWVGAASPGRMGLPATITLLLLATALILASGPLFGRGRRAAAYIGMGAAFVPLTSLVAYWYGARQLYAHPKLTGISFQTAWVLLLIAAGLVFAVREFGVAAMLRRPGDAGTLLRRLLPTLGVALLTIGWIRIVGERRELYDSPFGTALFAVIMIVLLFATVLWTARAIEEQAEARERTEKALAGRAAEQAALFQFTDRLHRAADLGQVCEAALDAISRALGCDRASVLLYDDAGVMRFVGWRGLSDAYRRAAEGHSAWAPDDPDPQPVCVDDVSGAELDEELRRVIRSEGLGALAFIPLVADGRLIGKFMVYYNRPHRFGEAEINLALAIARQLAFGVRRVRTDSALRRERELLQAIIDRIPVMITLYEPDARVLRLNPEFERTLGWSAQEAGGVSLMESCYPEEEHRERVSRFMQACEGGWMDIRMRTRDGRDIETSWANVRLSDRTQVGIGIDITNRKQTEETLRRLNIELERFASIASHDLKEPLRGIAYLCSFVEEDEPSLSFESRRRLGRVRALCERLHAMVAGLLEFSRSAGGVRSEVCDLSVVAGAAIDTLAETIAAERAQVEIAGPLPTVLADPALVERTLGNLISNALRYNTSAEKRVQIGVREASPPTIFVRDNGVGIPAEYHGKVFEVFRRGPAASSPTAAGASDDGGIGLGLALVKRWMEVQGGSVDLESEPGRGSCFLLRFQPAPAYVVRIGPLARQGQPDAAVRARTVVGEPEPSGIAAGKM